MSAIKEILRKVSVFGKSSVQRNCIVKCVFSAKEFRSYLTGD